MYEHPVLSTIVTLLSQVTLPTLPKVVVPWRTRRDQVCHGDALELTTPQPHWAGGSFKIIKAQILNDLHGSFLFTLTHKNIFLERYSFSGPFYR